MTLTTPIVLITSWYGCEFFELGVMSYAAFSNLFLICFMMYLDRRDMYGQRFLYDTFEEMYLLIGDGLINISQGEETYAIHCLTSINRKKMLTFNIIQFNRRIFFTRKIVFIMLILNYAFTIWKLTAE